MCPAPSQPVWHSVDATAQSDALDPYSAWLLKTLPRYAGGHGLRADASDSPRFLVLQSQADPFDPVTHRTSLNWTSQAKVAGKTQTRHHAIVTAENADDGDALPMQQIAAALGAQADKTLLHLAPLDDVMMPDVGTLDTTQTPVYTPSPDLNPDTAVILGVIDDGINVAHERFLEPDGSPRVDFAWVQDGIAKQTGSTVLFGRELTAPEIETALTQNTTEEETLRQLGLIRPATPYASSLAKRFSHGTFVMDKAAGYPSARTLYADGALPAENNGAHPADRRLITVQIPRRASLETSGALYALFAASGLRYILDRARVVAKAIRKGAFGKGKAPKIPLVINFSYGLAGGPHNGQHPIEHLIDDMMAEVDADPDVGPLVVPMPAGNRYALKGHAHQVAEDAGETTLALDWVTQPWDATANYLELWVPQTAAGKTLEVVVTPPPTSDLQPLSVALPVLGPNDPALGTAHEVQNGAGDVLARVSMDQLDAKQLRPAPTGTSGNKVRVLIALRPTQPMEPKGAALAAGVWQVTATCALAQGERIEAWVQRDDTPPGFRRQARMSYLERRDDTPPVPGRATREALEEYNTPLGTDAGRSAHGTLSGIATGDSMIIVAGSRLNEDNMPALYSGAAHDGMRCPDLVMPADRSRVHAGVLGASGRSGGSYPVNGTSASAPIMARVCADHLAKSASRPASAAAKAAILADTTTPLEAPEIDGPAARVLDDAHLRALRGRIRTVKLSLLPRDGFHRI